MSASPPSRPGIIPHDGGASKLPRVEPLTESRASPTPSPTLSVPSSPDGGAVPECDDDRPTRPGDLPVVPASVLNVVADHALLTVLSGVNAGQVFTLDRDENSLGRSKDADVHVDGVGISRRHARIVRTGDGHHVLEDLDASNGVFVNGRRVQRVKLGSGDRVQLGPAVVLRFALVHADEKALAYQLYEGSTRDALTRTYNRRYLNERLAEEVSYARRHGTRLGLILFDLDHFKRTNELHGHLAGDMVLRIVAAHLERIVGQEDVLARYGGEEFAAIVRGIEHKNIGILAERLRRAAGSLSIPWESTLLQVTISVGVASLDECAVNTTPEALVQLADERLYRAKADGRNRVCLGSPGGP